MASTGGLLRPRARARCRGVCDRARVCVFDFVCSLFALCLLFVCFFFRRCCCLFLLLFVFFLLLFTCFLFAFVLLFLFFAFLFVLFSFIYCLFILCLSGGFIHAHTRCVYVYICVCVCCVCGVCAYLHFRWGAKTLCGGLVLARVVACVIVFYCCFCA